MNEAQAGILLIVTDQGAAPGTVVERDFGADVAGRVASAVGAQTTAFLEHVQDVLRARPHQDGDFELPLVDFAAQVTAEGKVCLLGSGGQRDGRARHPPRAHPQVEAGRLVPPCRC